MDAVVRVCFMAADSPSENDSLRRIGVQALERLITVFQVSHTSAPSLPLLTPAQAPLTGCSGRGTHLKGRQAWG